MAVLAAELIIGSARLMRFLLLRSSKYAGAFINACVSFHRLRTTMGLGPAGSRITDGAPTR
eukprot:9379412-Pyramimonas_sp.AAC.1